MSHPPAGTPMRKRLLDFLPAIYAEGDSPEKSSFLAGLLGTFEAILFGPSTVAADDGASTQPSPRVASQATAPGLEGEILDLPSLLDPLRTRKDFLPWLAGWAALSFHPDLREERRRRLLAAIIPLYRIRGTRRYIEELLTLTTDCSVSVSDGEIGCLAVGTRAAVGIDTYLSGGPPHFFRVRLIAPNLNEEERSAQTSIARSILDLARPAHTSFHLSVVSPRMQVGVHSAVGLDTVIGPA